MYIFTITQVCDPTVDDFTVSCTTTEPCLLSPCYASKLPLFYLACLSFSTIDIQTRLTKMSQSVAGCLKFMCSVELSPGSNDSDISVGGHAGGGHTGGGGGSMSRKKRDSTASLSSLPPEPPVIHMSPVADINSPPADEVTPIKALPGWCRHEGI